MQPWLHRDTMQATQGAKNILIYGNCRYQNAGCVFNHDQLGKDHHQSPQQSDPMAKKLNVDSPAFTPSAPKRVAFTPNNANAVPFTPLGPGMSPAQAQLQQQTSPMDTGNPYSQAAPGASHMTDYQPFGMPDTMGMAADHTGMHDAFSNMQSLGAHLPGIGHYTGMQYDTSALLGASSFDPYTSRAAAAAAAAFNMPASNDPPRYHLYAPVGPEPVLKGRGNVRTSEIFMKNELREEMQKKQAASAQVLLTNSPLPPVVGEYNTLVPLDTTNTRKSTTSFGFNSWIYKAYSSKNGRPYCLRRLEDFQLSNANAVRRVNEWRSIWCGSIVHVEDAFTTTDFGDNSLVFVQDYYPCARTLLEQHFTPPHTSHGTQYRRTMIPETTLWSYLSQIAHALRMIHQAGAAARCVELSKIIVVGKNRIKLSGCAISDVVKFSEQTPIQQLQMQDLEKMGKVMLALMANNPVYATPTLQPSQLPSLIGSLQRQYKQDLVDAVSWLLTPVANPQQKTVQEFLTKIQHRVYDEFDAALSREDRLRFELGREIEHGRIARLVMKINVVVDRPEHKARSQETESVYVSRLFKDYVFHQVDSTGAPLVDLGHMMECLNKVDVGTDDQVCLTATDDQTVFVVTFAEIRKHIQAAFNEVIRRGPSNAGPGY
ncbi:pab-dependent poly -specific ribonuclease subunit pan3 [Zalerion maritima]|uniref:PAN2-PAN3 deadenylation complex subunit PAN3 n=1 Tax=Zalerion maritima TaxID=339359 RepID=A0AAD5WXL7_9PEZI|nr:pab-dependent poly -specific ribonuclease subunit pan3 [Zalerion maritima]